MLNAFRYASLCGSFARRRFLHCARAAALGFAGVPLFISPTHADALTKAQRDRMTPEAIIDEME